MRKLMWFAVGFALACAVGAYAFGEHIGMYAIIGLLLGVACAVGTRWVRNLRIPATVLLSFALGIGWFSIYNSVILSPARNLDSQIQHTQMEVTDHSTQTDYGCTVSAELTVEDRKYPVIIYFNEGVSCNPGDLVTGNFTFRFTAEGGRKDPTYHRGDGVFLLAYPAGNFEFAAAEVQTNRHLAANLRTRLIQTIESIFPSDAAGFAKALLLGDRSGIDYETNTAFKISGISHIIAVSGLHVSILFGILMLISGRNRYLLILIGMPLLVLFSAIAGFTPSITRACIMQALALAALLLNREYDPPTALAAAGLVMLIVNPMVIISVSFQLSFGCMIGIYLFAGRIFDWIMAEKRWGTGKKKGILATLKRGIAGSVSISLGASVITTPLVAVYFGTVSLVSVVTNLLVVWLIAYIFYGIMLACGVGLLHLFAGRIIALLITYPIRLVIGTAKLLSEIPLAAVYTESVYIVAWLLFSYLLLAVYLLMKKKPVVVFGCLSAICLCASLIGSWVEPLLDPCRVTMLDVGQGQCIMLQSEGKTFLVDCGGSGSWNTADKAAETLLSQGISKLDGVILTHYDEDHAGGLPYLLMRVPADTIYLPDIADSDGIAEKLKLRHGEQVVTVTEDISFTYGDTNVTIFGPESYHLGNESSLCVLFQANNCDILITGDRGSLGEMLLLHRAALPELDVLVAGHHGSAGSTGEELLEVTKPKYIFVSAGENNRYGHPAEDLLQRLAQFGCFVFRTDLNGTILYRG